MTASPSRSSSRFRPVAAPVPSAGPDLTPVLGRLPYRLALAGGWIDQPFISRLDPEPPGSMVVVGVEPSFRFMDRSGMSTSTRTIAHQLWQGQLPDRPADELVRELYARENQGKLEPSGSQDMIGLVYPGINRLDYDYRFEGGVFPKHIASTCDPRVVAWLERILQILPVGPRPDGYNPLGEKHLDPAWIRRLGQSGRACYAAIGARDLPELGAALNECMRCWQALLPHTVRHPTLTVDLAGLLACYQARYPGAMYSGCGGGYLLIASEDPVPGAFHPQVRRGAPGGRR